MSGAKNGRLKEFIRFFCTKMPYIGLVGGALAWAFYLFYPNNGHSIDDSQPLYWKLMGGVVWLMIISGALFFFGFVGYLIYRPLGTKLKWLKVILRLILAAAAAVVTSAGVYLSIFIFAGAGF